MDPRSRSKVSRRTLIPTHITFENYTEIFGNKSFGLFVWNTFLVSILMVLASWYLNSMAAYGFSRARFVGKEWVYILILSTMLAPIEATVVPTYVIARSLHLDDTLWGLIIPWIAEPSFSRLDQLSKSFKNCSSDQDCRAAELACPNRTTTNRKEGITYNR